MTLAPSPTTTPAPDEARGRQLLNAVERILARDEDLVALVQKHANRTRAKPGESKADWRRRVAKALVSDFSSRSALSGGAAALPALVPGIGSLIAVVGGAMADMALTLNYTPRQVSKVLATVLGRLALLAVSKSFVRVLPVVGVVVGASANKVLTTKVGTRCTEQLDARRKEREAAAEVGPKVRADVGAKRTKKKATGGA